jgi:hypothetical protein
MIIKIIAWVIVFPIIGIALEKLGLDSHAYFAFYGAVFAHLTYLIKD